MGFAYEYLKDNTLNEKFTSIFRSGYISVKGTTLPERYKDLHEDIENLEVYNDDVWICSFPKTGTTWTQEMVWMIMNNLNFQGAKTNLGERFPFLDFSFIFDYRKVFEKYNDFNPEDFLVDSVKYIKELKGPRFIKTHLPWNLLPKQIQNGTKSPKIIYVTRNPKDTCVSYYHHCRFIEGYKGNFQDFCRLFIEGKLSFAPFWTNISKYWEKRNQPNIYFLKYEDLKSDLPSTIRKVADFLEKDLTEEQVDLLKAHLSFSNMKNNKAVNYGDLILMHKKYGMIEEDGNFIRSGNVNGYKGEMIEELVKLFDTWIEEHPYSKEVGY